MNENPPCIDLNESGLKRGTIWRICLFPGQVSHKWSSTALMEIKTSSDKYWRETTYETWKFNLEFD